MVPLYVGGGRPSGPLGIFTANRDIGTVASAGSTIDYTGSNYFIDGSGSDIGGSADSFQCVDAPWTGTTC